jgi:hypothetical protein
MKLNLEKARHGGARREQTCHREYVREKYILNECSYSRPVGVKLFKSRTIKEGISLQGPQKSAVNHKTSMDQQIDTFESLHYWV